MGLFTQSSPLDQYVEPATSEKNVTDDWSLIVDVCDRINDSDTGVTDGMRAISKRLKHDNPRVQLQAITLLDACISNCKREFRLKVAEREFEQELHKLLTCSKTHVKVSEKLRECLKKWAEGDFRNDTQLGLIPALYMKMQQQGYSFDAPSDVPKQSQKFSTDPNVVQSQQEEDDIVKAIQLSLQDTGSTSFKTTNQQKYNTTETKKESGGLYSSATAALATEFSGGSGASVIEKEQMKVRALYDFEAAEDNELTFKAGEIIVVTNHNDANWWEGSNHRGDGLFPSNFVTDNLYEDDDTKQENSSGKKVSFSESVEVTEVRDDFSPSVEPTGEVDEEKINHLLHILHEADPTAERPDDPALPSLEEQVNAMAPTIDVELEQIDRMHAQLARISTDLVGGLSLYHQLMREMPPTMQYYSPYSAMPPGMVAPHMSDAKQPPYMQPVGMQQMYQQPNHPPQYMPMPVADATYIPTMPPHTQTDMPAMPTHALPPSEYPQGQPPTSYQAPPSQVNYVGTYPYVTPSNTSFESQLPIYSHPTMGNMPQPNVSGRVSYQLTNMMDPAAAPPIPSSTPSMMMPPHMNLPPQANPNQQYMTHGMPPGQMGQMVPGLFSNNMAAVHPTEAAGLPPQTNVPYQPTAMQQPLL